jgi:uncharacterized protein (DUF983 family)
VTSFDWPRPSAATAFRRALMLRCPRCGSTGIFRRLTMIDACPRCGLVFERSQGYWLGAMTLNLALTIAVVVGVLVGWIVVAWPDVPWTAVTVAGAAAGVLVPVLFYDHSKVLWVALERQFRSRSEPYD